MVVEEAVVVAVVVGAGEGAGEGAGVAVVVAVEGVGVATVVGVVKEHRDKNDRVRRDDRADSIVRIRRTVNRTVYSI